MKKTIVIGSTVWRGKRGTAVVDVTDFAANDPDHQQVPTIREWKQRFGGTHKQLIHPFTQKAFSFDLSPWSHLPEDTHLKLEWKFIVDHSSSPARSKQ